MPKIPDVIGMIFSLRNLLDKMWCLTSKHGSEILFCGQCDWVQAIINRHQKHNATGNKVEQVGKFLQTHKIKRGLSCEQFISRNKPHTNSLSSSTLSLPQNKLQLTYALYYFSPQEYKSKYKKGDIILSLVIKIYLLHINLRIKKLANKAPCCSNRRKCCQL